MQKIPMPPIKAILAILLLVIVAAAGAAWFFIFNRAEQPPVQQERGAPDAAAGGTQTGIAQFNSQLPRKLGDATLTKLEFNNNTLHFLHQVEFDPYSAQERINAHKDTALQQICSDSNLASYLQQGAAGELVYQYQDKKLIMPFQAQECNAMTAAAPAAPTAQPAPDQAAPATTATSATPQPSITPAPTPAAQPAPPVTAAVPTPAATPADNKPKADNLQALVARINSNLPQPAEQNQTLKKVQLQNKVVRFEFENKVDPYPIKKDIETIKSSLIRITCSREETHSFLQQGLTVEYVQSYKQQRLIVSVHQKDCQK